jgi:uncharacterized membrane protein YcaP (DUF421 family)
VARLDAENIHLTDWKRILLGSSPWWFTFEVFARTAIVYLVLLIVIRIIGKRLSGQLTILELGIMITLGAIVSAPMVMPDKGIVIGFILLGCALGFLRGTGSLGVRSERFERLTQGRELLLVKDGVLILKALDQARLSRNVIYASLRNKGLYHLGQVKRVYLEACGIYSILEEKERKPGLSIFPDPEREHVSRSRAADGWAACSSCGCVLKDAGRPERCPRCNEQRWTKAVILEDAER